MARMSGGHKKLLAPRSLSRLHDDSGPKTRKISRIKFLAEEAYKRSLEKNESK